VGIVGKYPKCEESYTPYCEFTCIDKSDKKPFKIFGKSAYLVNQSAPVIQAEIYTNGPVEASFTVYHDFVPYQSGVYVHNVSSGGYLGGHAIKIIGWGVTSSSDSAEPMPYWLVANSWNEVRSAPLYCSVGNV
jgi:cathepsin B